MRMFLCTNPHQRFLSVTGLLALRPHLCESPLTLLQRKLISRATKGKDSMQSLLECALASPRITRLIAQEAGRIRTLDFRSCQHLSDAPLLNVLAACTQLQRFMVSYAPGTDNGKQITDESVLALAKHCPNLSEVVLQNCVNLTDNAVKYAPRVTTPHRHMLCAYLCLTVHSAVLAASARTLENLSLKGVPDVRLLRTLYTRPTPPRSSQTRCCRTCGRASRSRSSH